MTHERAVHRVVTLSFTCALVLVCCACSTEETRDTPGVFRRAKRLMVPAVLVRGHVPAHARGHERWHGHVRWQERWAAHTRAMAELDTWRDLVRALQAALPDHHVADRTRRYLNEPAYVIEIMPKDESREGSLVGMVSFVAPIYFICQSVGHRTIARARSWICCCPMIGRHLAVVP